MSNSVLIIEDDSQMQKIYQEALTAQGYQVNTAATGKEGLHLIRTTNPDLVILDIMLPQGMNGFDILEEMKKDQAMKTIPVVVLTNLDSEQKVAMDIGAQDYLVKANTTIEEVVAKVKKYIKA